MRLVVFGPTGGTGQAVIRMALAAGHRVVAVARRPEALVLRHARLETVRGDVLDPDTLTEPVAGADAVLSALGIGYSRAATTVYSEGTGNVIAAMRAAAVRRLLVVSTTSLAAPGWTEPLRSLMLRGLLHPLLRRPYADMRAMEERVRGSGLDWTLVRAARLTDGPATNRYRIAVDGQLRGGWSVSRTDLAGCLLAGVDDPQFVRRTVEIAY